MRTGSAQQEVPKWNSINDYVSLELSRNVMEHRKQLLKLLKDKSLSERPVVLASGRRSDYYFDCKQTTLDPEGTICVGNVILEHLKTHGLEPDAIGGLSMGADPIVSATVAVSHLRGEELPGFLIRKERKKHGLERQVEGYCKKGSQVVIVDEVCTSGKSILEAIDAAQKEGLEIIGVISLVDREEGGREVIQKKYPHFPYHSVFTVDEIRTSIATQPKTGDETTKNHNFQKTPL